MSVLFVFFGGEGREGRPRGGRCFFVLLFVLYFYFSVFYPYHLQLLFSSDFLLICFFCLTSSLYFICLLLIFPLFYCA